jgi:hypothetical protein
LTHFMAAKRPARVGAVRRAMPHGFPGYRASAATHPAGRFAPPKAALKGRLAAPVGYKVRSACGAPRQGARPRLARRPSRAVKWVNIHALWYYNWKKDPPSLEGAPIPFPPRRLV